MKNRITFIFIFIALLSLCACQQENGGTRETAEKTRVFDLRKAGNEIKSLDSLFSEKLKSGDSVGLAAMYAKGAAMVSGKKEPIVGEGILSALGGWIRSSRKNNSTILFTTTDLFGDEQYLIETGMAVTRNDSLQVTSEGKYIVVWKKEEGTWKLFRDIGL
ncbi:MAG: DUF4440 domain-containing protein [Terrimonas sp.]|nr:DUF4440 domain-containing protein [Terrimonas sp.]